MIFLFSLMVVSLGIWGIHILFQQEHLLEKEGDWIRKKLGKKWSKPIVHCPICMSSVWGVLGFFNVEWYFDFDLSLKQLPPFVMCLCGLNTILHKLTSKERIILDE